MSEIRVIRLTAPWCGPCGTYAPVLDAVAKEWGVEVEAIDVDKYPQRAVDFGATSVPTTIALNENDEVVAQFSGARNKAALNEWFEEVL